MITRKRMKKIIGQALAEFALALPILLLLIVGLLEVGRAVFILASVKNASHEAARYAAAYGVNSNEELRYQDCDGIRNAAKHTGFLVSFADEDIVIEYDEGPDPDTGVVPAAFDACNDSDGVDEAVVLECGDRIKVTVTAYYSPMTPLIPIKPRPIVSSSTRSYYGVIELDPDATPCDE